MLDNWYECTLFLLAVLSVSLQLYAMVLIITVSPPAMHAYRYFLCFYTVGCSLARSMYYSLKNSLAIQFWDICLTVLLGVAEPEPLFPAKAVFLNGPIKYLGSDWCKLIVSPLPLP